VFGESVTHLPICEERKPVYNAITAEL